MKTSLRIGGLAFLLASAFLPLWTSVAFASPASPELMSFHQPDGSRFSGKVLGDEFQRWVETDEGHSVAWNGLTEDNGPWGPIVTESGPYVPGTIDWDPENPPSVTVLDNSDPCDCYDQSLAKAIQDINSAEIPYNPFLTNSNAAVRESLERAGFKPSNPPVWVPGWGTHLP